jgi:outer membrane protein assembly factor BamB
MDGTMIGPPLIEAGLITVVSDGGTLRSYSTLGNHLWTFSAYGRLSPYLGRSPDGTTYICRNTGILIAINRAGRELWRRKLEEPLAAPVISGWDGRVFLFTAKHIYCFNAAGYPLWTKSLESPIGFGPVMDSGGGFTMLLENGTVLEGNAFGKIAVRELPPESIFGEEDESSPPRRAGGSGRRRQRESPARKPLPALKMALPLEGRALLLLYSEGSAVLLPGSWDAASGAVRAEILSNIGGTPAAGISRGNRAAVMLAGGRLVFIGGESDRGRGPDILWSAETHAGNAGSAEAKLVYHEQGIYVLSKTGITGFSESGERILSFNLRNIAALPALDEDETLYAGGNDWILYAFRPEEKRRPAQRSAGARTRKSYGTADPRLPSLEQYPYVFDEADIGQDLKEINRRARAGATGEQERLTTAYLMEIATNLRRNTLPREPGSAPLALYYRVEALRLLGHIGSRETIPFLAQICSADPEPAVRAAAASAIGRIGVDPEGTALRAFTGLIYPPGRSQDDQTLLAVASAIGALCRFSGPPLSDTGARLLVALQSDQRSLAVQRRARQELSAMQ